MPTPSTSTQQRFFYAGAGATAPVFLSLLVIDLQTLLVNLTALAVIAYLIRFALLFVIGGFVGVLHKTEHNAFKLFQLGIAAPALITAALNGSRVQLPDAPSTPHASWQLIGSAYAQTPLAPKQFAMPPESPVQQVYRGLLGRMQDNVYYVVAGSHSTLEAATAQARLVRAQGFTATVYQPYGDSIAYSVVIGANLTVAQARELRTRAIRAGLPKDTFIWTFNRH